MMSVSGENLPAGGMSQSDKSIAMISHLLQSVRYLYYITNTGQLIKF